MRLPEPEAGDAWMSLRIGLHLRGGMPLRRDVPLQVGRG
jgi:hypothetical protein